MAANAADFTLTFHYLAETAVNVSADDTVRRLFKDPLAFDSWAVKWRERPDDRSLGQSRPNLRVLITAVVDPNRSLQPAV
jgi:uncharacterized protein YdiU (UPF0061 family)